MIKKRLNIITDMFLNLIASGIPIAALQLLVYPFLSRRLSVEDYALMLAFYSLWMLVSNTLGNCILNVRLIKNNSYIQNHLEGDFLNILLKYSLLNLVIISVVSIVYLKSLDWFSIFTSIIISFAILFKAYLDVGFRIQINYKLVVIASCIIGCGFVLGYFIAVPTRRFQYVFLCAYIPACIFVSLKTKLFHENKTKTSMYQETFRDCNNLTLSCVISNLMVYADKLILLPLLGAESVAIYYNSTLLGKIVGQVTGPISSVVLTYISKWKKGKDNFVTKVVLLCCIIACIGYFIVLIVARPILAFLYPMWVDDIMKYIPITTLNVCLITVVAMMNPFLLKFRKITWQVIIGVASSLIYFVSAIILQHYYGLMGFCIGTVIGSFVRLVLLLYAYYSKRIGE